MSCHGIRALCAATIALCFALASPARAWENVGDSVLPDFYNDSTLSASGIDLDDYEQSSVDYFSGMLTRSATDLSIPGPGGMAITVRRSYQSQQPTVWPEQTALGIGWTMHFGWVEITDPGKLCNVLWSTSIMDNPVLHMPDGSSDVMALTYDGMTAMIDPTKVHYRSKGGMGLICDWSETASGRAPFRLVAPDGTRYTLEQWSSGGAITGFFKTAKYFVNHITDRNQNSLHIEYTDLGTAMMNNVVVPTLVSASDGRQVHFLYAGLLLQSISYAGKTVARYTYTPSDNGGNFYLLQSVDLGSNLRWQYEYSSASSPGAGSMTKATNPFGGQTRYTWDLAYFRSGLDLLTNSVVVGVEQSAGGMKSARWQYAYSPAGLSGGRDRTSVSAPEGNYEYTHFSAGSVQSGEVWKIGLKDTVVFTPSHGGLMRTETYSWEPWFISQENNKRTKEIGAYAAVDEYYYGAMLARQEITIGNAHWVKTNSTWTWGALGVPQPQTVTYQGPDGTVVTHGFRYRSWPDRYLHGLLRQAFRVQALHPGTSPMQIDYDESGNPVARYEDGHWTFMSYDEHGDLQSSTVGMDNAGEGEPHTTLYGGYEHGVASQITHPDGSVTSRDVDAWGRITRETDRDGRTVHYAYDGVGRVTSIDYPVGNDVSVEYSGSSTRLQRGNYVSVKDADGFGRNLAESHRDSGTGRELRVTREYDESGRVVFVSYPNSASGTRYEYDSYGRLTRVSHPGGFRRYFHVDGGETTECDENGNCTTIVRSEVEGPGKGDIVRIESPEGIVTDITRNEYGLPLLIAQGRAGAPLIERARAYSASLLLTSSDEPETGHAEYGYDAAGQLVSIARRESSDGPVRTQYNVYDVNGRLAQSWAAPQERPYESDFYTGELFRSYIEMTYTPGGKPLAQTRREDVALIDILGNAHYYRAVQSTWLHEYDANGNLQRETAVVPEAAWSFVYGYDGNDRLATITYPDGATVDYAPDAFGWPTRAGEHAANVRYHASGQLAGFDYGNGRSIDIAINDRWLIAGIGVPDVTSLSYGYDPAGNVTGITDSMDATQNVALAYDGMNRLVVADGEWGAGLFEYDAVGNITRKKTGDDDLVFGYDDRNRLATVSGSRNHGYDHDAFGNVARRDQTRFGYDGMGNLLVARNADSDLDTWYQYDARGRRIVTTTHPGGVGAYGSGGVKTYSLYASGDRLLYEDTPSVPRHTRNVYLGAIQIAHVDSFIGCAEDIDSDGIPHCVEEEAGLNPWDPLDALGDRDDDGIANLEEYLLGTGINDADSDDDGIKDGIEVSYGLDPKFNDAEADADSDGLPNIVEVVRGFNPQSAADGAADDDGDGLTASAEYALGTNWLDDDSDNDGMSDGYEVAHGLAPLQDDRAADHDNDGLPNGWEFENGFDPSSDADASTDDDHDGLTALQEYGSGTSPTLSDTDNDGMSDGIEVTYHLDPLVNDANKDKDGDGLPNKWELDHGMDPGNPADALQDPDGDGLSIAQEYAAGTDPWVADALQAVDDLWVASAEDANYVAWVHSPLAQWYSVDYGILGDAIVNSSPASASTSFTHTGLGANTLYWYRVRATDKQGNSLTGRTVVAIPGTRAHYQVPMTLSSNCDATRMAPLGADGFLFACAAGGDIAISRYASGRFRETTQFAVGRDAVVKGNWDLDADYRGRAVLAWIDRGDSGDRLVSDVLRGATFDAGTRAWSAPFDIESETPAAGVPAGYVNSVAAFDAVVLPDGRLQVYYGMPAQTTATTIGVRLWRYWPYTFGITRIPVQAGYFDSGELTSLIATGGGVYFEELVVAGTYGKVQRFVPAISDPVMTATGPVNTVYTTPATVWESGYMGAIPLDASARLISRINIQTVNRIGSAVATCGNNCLETGTPMSAMVGADVPAIFGWADQTNRHVLWPGNGAINWSKWVQDAKGVWGWTSAATLVADPGLTDPSSVKFGRGTRNALLYWTSGGSEVRTTRVRSDGTWSTPEILASGEQLAALGVDRTAGNAVIAVRQPGQYAFREYRPQRSDVDLAADTTPPVVSVADVRSGTKTVKHVVTLGASDPANIFFSVTGGSIVSGGASTTDEQRYTGPLTITFGKGGSATLKYRAINAAQLSSGTVTTVLK